VHYDSDLAVSVRVQGIKEAEKETEFFYVCVAAQTLRCAQ